MISRLTGGSGLALLVSGLGVGLGLGGLAGCSGESVVGSGGGQSTTTTGGGTTSAGGQSTSGSTGGTGTSAAGGAGGSSNSAGGTGGLTTSSAGGMGGASTTSTTTSTGSGMTTQECKDCLALQCTTGIAAMCGGSFECFDWVMCWDSCSTPECYVDCDAQYPAYASVQQQMYDCVCAYCKNECVSGPASGCDDPNP